MSAPARPARTTRPERSGGPGLGARLRDWTSRPLFDYTVLLGVTFLLTGIGLVMVLSSSMATAGAEGGNVFGVFLRQALLAIIGLAAMWLALRTPVRAIRALATPVLLVSLMLLVLVLAIGVGLESTGAQSWLAVGGISIQPSEIAKVALALWGSKVLADRMRTATSIPGLFGVFSVGAGLVVALVLIQRDLGMTASIMIVIAALAWFSGLPRRTLLLIIAALAAVVVVFTFTAGFRSVRITTFLDTLMLNFPEHRGAGYQSYQGILSLADGSFAGVGLGQSRAKWFYLPEAKNDFIFAIIGEELGFLGAALVILLYLIMAWVGMRIAAKQADPFLRLLAATLTIATVVQAFINIGYVIGALPVTGLQLPLISAGGTSIVVTLATMGLLASCARHEPEAISAMRSSGMPKSDYWLRLTEPKPYDPADRGARKPAASRRPQRFGRPVTAVEPDPDRLDDGHGGIRDFSADDAAARRYERHDRDRRYRDDAGAGSVADLRTPRRGRGRYGERGRGGAGRPQGRRR